VRAEKSMGDVKSRGLLGGFVGGIQSEVRANGAWG